MSVSKNQGLNMPKRFISNGELRTLLTNATEEERLSLTKLLNPKKDQAYNAKKLPYNAKKLQKKICLEGGHDVINKVRDQGTGYLDIVDDVLDELEIEGFPSYSDEVAYYDELSPDYESYSGWIKDAVEMLGMSPSLKYSKKKARKHGLDYAEKAEEKIILALLEKAYDNMSPDEKKSFDEQVDLVAKNFESNSTRNLTGVTGLMLLGNMGGFATYTFLTTTMSTVTMGSLGFGAYTAATSFLSVILGPAGWAGLGAYAVYAYGAPEYQKLISIVATIGIIRQRIKYESQFELIKEGV